MQKSLLLSYRSQKLNSGCQTWQQVPSLNSLQPLSVVITLIRVFMSTSTCPRTSFSQVLLSAPCLVSNGGFTYSLARGFLKEMSSREISSFLCPCFLGIGVNVSWPIRVVGSTLIRLLLHKLKPGEATAQHFPFCPQRMDGCVSQVQRGNLLTQLCLICLATCAHRAVRVPQLDQLVSGSHRVSELLAA